MRLIYSLPSEMCCLSVSTALYFIAQVSFRIVTNMMSARKLKWIDVHGCAMENSSTLTRCSSVFLFDHI